MNKNPRQVIIMKSSDFIIAGAIVLIILSVGTPTKAQTTDWVVPASAVNVANPVASNDQIIALGKTIYTQNCYDCHGKKGKGDGPKSGDLTQNPQDFSKDTFQKQKDGEIFWKITQGRKPMPSFKKDLTDQQRWTVINYIRTLGAKK